MTEWIKELFNYGVLGIFAAFVLWVCVKGGRAVYDVLFFPGNETKKPQGIFVRLASQIQHNLEKNAEFMDRTAQVLISLESDLEFKREQCEAHVQILGQVTEGLKALVEVHRDPNGPGSNEKTHRKLCAIQQGMVEACILCKRLATKSKDVEIVQMVQEHCDAIIKKVTEEKI